jgi:hypothetical protein
MLRLRSLTPGAVFAIGVVLAVVFLAIANFPHHKGENGGTGPYITTVVFSIVVAAVISFWAFPRLESADGTRALVLAAVTLLSCAVFWSGLPFVLGPAAMALGARADEGARRGAAAVIVAGLAIVLAAIACAVG